MNSLSYFIIFVILGICLFISNKSQASSETFLNNLPSVPTSIDVEQLSDSSLKIKWTRPEDNQEPIKGYIIMLKNVNDIKKGVFLNFKIDETCINNCEYIIDNISLIPNMDYKIGVIAVNKNGGGPAIETTFKTAPLPTSTPTSSPSPSPSSSTTTTPTPTINSLDPYIDNMILRADGVYDWKGDYPDTYENDIKLSLKTLNDEVKKDLQEYRVNVHIGTVS